MKRLTRKTLGMFLLAPSLSILVGFVSYVIYDLLTNHDTVGALILSASLCSLVGIWLWLTHGDTNVKS